MGMSTYRIRSIALAMLASAIEMSAFGIHFMPLAWVECDTDQGGAAIMSDMAYCLPGKSASAAPTAEFSFWAEYYKENTMPLQGATYDKDKWSDVADAATAIGPSMAESIAGFGGLIGFFAFLELLGYTLGSKCVAIFTIIFSAINMALGFAAYPVLAGSGMLDEEFGDMMCALCGLTSDGTHTGTPMQGTNGMFGAGFMSIGTLIIGIVMLVNSGEEQQYASVAKDRVGGKEGTATPL